MAGGCCKGAFFHKERFQDSFEILGRGYVNSAHYGQPERRLLSLLESSVLAHKY